MSLPFFPIDAPRPPGAGTCLNSLRSKQDCYRCARNESQCLFAPGTNSIADETKFAILAEVNPLTAKPNSLISHDDFSLSDFLPYRIAILSERISKRLSLEYGRSHGLSMAEWRVLVHLARCGEVSIREIHNCVNLEKPRVSRTVARLEQAGLVRKGEGREDHRLVAISLTEKGHKVLDEILPAALDFEARLLEVLEPEELDRFLATAEKFHALLDEDKLAPPRSGMDRA